MNMLFGSWHEDTFNNLHNSSIYDKEVEKGYNMGNIDHYVVVWCI